MRVLLAALPAAVASVIVLRIAEVSVTLLYLQLAAMLAAGLIALAGPVLARRTHGRALIPLVTTVATLALCGPLFAAGPPPHRWLPVGTFNLYIAPVVLPAMFVTFALRMTQARHRPWDLLFAAVLPVGYVALHPDASQALAFTVGMTVLCTTLRPVHGSTWLTLAAMVAFTVYAGQQPDPLQPVPHVEGVFAVAWQRSWLAGLLVSAAAASWVAALAATASARRPWLVAAAAYYAVLFVCAVKGLTPAPIIGYGAGPILGVGVLAAANRAVE